MILSKYPYVIQKEILDNMEYSDLFMFSFVSKKMKKVIKSSQMDRFNSISSIVYECDRTDQSWVCISKKWIEIMRIVKHEEGGNGYFQLNVCGKTIDFRFLTEARIAPLQITYYHPHLAVSYHPFDRDFVIQSIQNYLLDFLGNSLKCNWRFEHIPINRQTSFHIPFIPKLQNVSFCVDFHLFGDRAKNGTTNFTEMEKLEKFFCSSPVLKSIKVSAGTSTAPFNPESKFYQTESVESEQDTLIFPAILSHFQGRQAFIRCHSCEIFNLIEFINRWKSGRALQKLEYLQIEIFEPELRPNQILNAVAAKQMNATSQPATHIVPKIYNWLYSKPNTDPIISHAYVVRETDSRVASVQIQDNTLSFGVWNKTEEEFLKMVS
ncbi:hypothetical protein B9Z55_002659 [Caenorhabditis nigoni]|uniref:F-box domain-containing protein n=2 Tax=Caenorhabditis nigoni TaxID=1611254 RepID=A0A2G5VLQ5_9PELO|nr:hypothetical protein B9Z55_002659 [Caenorhabditis nigoni]